MSMNSGTEQSFQRLLEKIYHEAQNNDALQKIRTKAWDQFLQMGLPTQASEVFRYLRLKNLYSPVYDLPKNGEISHASIQRFIYPECADAVLVFINGHYHPALSQTKALARLVICPIQEATKTYGAFLNNQWLKTLKEEMDPFAILNAALHSNGLFVYLPPKTVLETPIQILHFVDAHSGPAFITPRLQFFVGAQSQMEVVSSQNVLTGKDYFINCSIDFSIEEDSHVRYEQTIFDQTDSSWYFEAVRANLKRNSTFKTISLTNGSAGVRHDYRINLSGENAEAQLNGISMLDSKREAHTHILMEHLAPNCRSMQLFKSVLNDTSRSSFEGKIYVHQPAQKTDAFQLNNNLLLSDYAQAYSKPNLEIFADDVKASHGATMGQLDREELFYCKTRGFSDAQAKSLLVYGFCKEVIDMVSIPSLREEVIKRAQNFLKSSS